MEGVADLRRHHTYLFYPVDFQTFHLFPNSRQKLSDEAYSCAPVIKSCGRRVSFVQVSAQKHARYLRYHGLDFETCECLLYSGAKKQETFHFISSVVGSREEQVSFS